MPKIIALILTTFLVLSACNTPVPAIPTPASPPSVRVETLTPTTQPTATQTAAATLPATPAHPGAPDRPVFLAWPLPASIGTARISQYPNSAWSWHYLGLNEGYECPPMFGYLLDLSSYPYWRDPALPEDQDKAQADPHQFEMVECYFSEGTAGANGHEGTDIKAPPGTPVFAVADGQVQEWRAEGLYAMIVLEHCIGGAWDSAHQCADGRKWYTTYMHIVPDRAVLQENYAVEQGTQLGTIFDQTINSHLHFEVGLDKRGYANFVNPWGMDRSPWLGCMWLDPSLCTHPDPDYQRLAYTTPAGLWFVQQGFREPVQLSTPQDAQRVLLWGDRVAVLDSEHNLWVKDGLSPVEDPANWKLAAENVLDFQISGRRLAILDENRALLVLEAGIPAGRVLQAEHVLAFSVSDHRLGYLTADGKLRVQEGEIGNEWVSIAENVLAFQVIDNRIAYMDRQRSLYVNEGEVQAEFQHMASRVQAFQVTNVRMGILDLDNRFLVKEGNLRAGWVPQAEDVQAFQLADNRILVHALDGQFSIKKGSIYQEWLALPSTGRKNVLLNGAMPVFYLSSQ